MASRSSCTRRSSAGAGSRPAPRPACRAQAARARGESRYSRRPPPGESGRPRAPTVSTKASAKLPVSKKNRRASASITCSIGYHGGMPQRSRIALGFAIIYLLWGGTFLAIKIGDQTLPPLVLAAARFLAAGALVWAWATARGEAQPRAREWAGALAVAAGVAAVLAALIPLWVAALEAWVYRSAPASMQVVGGCVLGAAGVALLMSGHGAGATDATAALALVGASFAWALGTVVQHRWTLPRTAAMSSAAQMLAGGGLLAGTAAMAGEFSGLHWGAFGGSTGWALAYLVLAGSVIGYSAYIWLLGHVAAVRVASYALVNPVVALGLGWAWAGERISGEALMGSVVILAALGLVLSRGA